MSQVTKELFLPSFFNILNQRPTKYELSPSVSLYHATQAKTILYISSSLPQELYVQSQKELCCTRHRLSEKTMNLGREKFCINIFSKVQTFSSQGV